MLNFKIVGIKLFFTLSIVTALMSGVTIVVGPLFALKITNDAAYVGYYFAGYALICLFVNWFIGRSLNKHGGLYYLKVSAFCRLFFLFLSGLSAIFFGMSSLLVIVMLCASAALADSISRCAIPVYGKLFFKDHDLQMVTACYSLGRQLGYILGAALAGFILSKMFGYTYFVMFLISLIALPIVYFMKKDQMINPGKGQAKSCKQGSGLYEILNSNGLVILFSAILVSTFATYLLPMNVTPLAIKYKQMTTFELGIVEAALSVGTALGTLFFARIVNGYIVYASLLLCAVLLSLLVHMDKYTLFLCFAIFGFLLQAFIPVVTLLHRRCPGDVIGIVSSKLQLYATILSVLVMASLGISKYINPYNIYMLVSCLFVISVVLLKQSYSKSRIEMLRHNTISEP